MKKFLAYAILFVCICSFAKAEENANPESGNNSDAPSEFKHLVDTDVTHQDTSIKVKPGAPPGFEDLANPQTTAVDVYYGDRLVGTTLATYTPETIEFDYPEEIVSLIPRIENFEAVQEALSGPLETNADKLCLTEIQRDCGFLEPAVAGIIFDEGYFRLTVFINAYYLENQNIAYSKFIPESETGFSTIGSNNISFSGNDNEDNYTFASSEIFGYKQSRFRFDWDLSNTKNISVNNISLQNDKSVWTSEAGVFKSSTRNSSFYNEIELLGARLYSSTNTRTDLDYSYSTDIFLFLSSPSVVEIYKDEKLAAAQEYEAGNQQIDTRHLPNGSYPITLRITDSQGVTREEEYFFAKTELLPPKDQPLYFAELGKIGESEQDNLFPKFIDKYFGRAGASYRLQDNLGANFELLQSSDIGVIQGGGVYLGNQYNIQSNLMYSNEGDWGIDLNGQMKKFGSQFNLNYRKVDNNDESNFENEISIIPQSFTQASFSASRAFAGGTINFRARQNKRGENDSVDSIGLQYRRPIYRKNRYQINFNTSGFIEDDDMSINLGLTFTRSANSFQLSSNTRYTYEDNNGITDSDVEYFGNAVYSDQDPTFGKYSLGLHVNDTVSSKSVGARARSQSSLGKMDLLLENIDNETSDDITRYLGNASFSIFSSDKKLAWGGEQRADSGVIIELESDATDSPFEVFVNRQPYGYAETGKSTVIALRSYNEYEIQIKPRGDEIVHFDDRVRRVNLYPGNVETLSWEVSPITILISNAVSEDGSPVEFAKFENTINFAATDAGGWFQIEIADREPLVLSKQGKPLCEIVLPEFEVQQGVAFLDEIVCSPIQDLPKSQ